MQDTKKLTVAYGTFACVVEGFDDPFPLMQETVAYFESLSQMNPEFAHHADIGDFEALRERFASEGADIALTAIPGGVVIRNIAVDDAIDAVPVPVAGVDVADRPDTPESVAQMETGAEDPLLSFDDRDASEEADYSALDDDSVLASLGEEDLDSEQALGLLRAAMNRMPPEEETGTELEVEVEVSPSHPDSHGEGTEDALEADADFQEAADVSHDADLPPDMDRDTPEMRLRDNEMPGEVAADRDPHTDGTDDDHVSADQTDDTTTEGAGDGSDSPADHPSEVLAREEVEGSDSPDMPAADEASVGDHIQKDEPKAIEDAPEPADLEETAADTEAPDERDPLGLQVDDLQMADTVDLPDHDQDDDPEVAAEQPEHEPLLPRQEDISEPRADTAAQAELAADDALDAAGDIPDHDDGAIGDQPREEPRRESHALRPEDAPESQGDAAQPTEEPVDEPSDAAAVAPDHDGDDTRDQAREQRDDEPLTLRQNNEAERPADAVAQDEEAADDAAARDLPDDDVEGDPDTLVFASTKDTAPAPLSLTPAQKLDADTGDARDDHADVLRLGQPAAKPAEDKPAPSRGAFIDTRMTEEAAKRDKPYGSGHTPLVLGKTDREADKSKADAGEPAKGGFLKILKGDPEAPTPAEPSAKTEPETLEFSDGGDAEPDKDKSSFGLGRLMGWGRKPAPAADEADPEDDVAAPQDPPKPAAQEPRRAPLRVVTDNTETPAPTREEAPREKQQKAEPAPAPAAEKPRTATETPQTNMAERLHASFADSDARPSSDSFSIDESELLGEEDRSVRRFVYEVGADNLQDLMKACAAYLIYAENKTTFTRGELLSLVQTAAGDKAFSAEARIRAFGKLVRGGDLTRVDGGNFTPANKVIEGYREQLQRIAV